MSTQDLPSLIQPPLSTWSAFQVSHYIKSIPEVGLYTRPLTFFERLCAEGKYVALIVHMLNAARACIPNLWKSTTTPFLKQWFSRIDEIRIMENMTVSIYGREEEIRNTWWSWMTFTCTPLFTDCLA